MNNIDQLNILSEKYRKYILTTKINKINYFIILGADLSDNAKDKILIDSNKKILCSQTITDLFDYILKHKVFDNLHFKEWVMCIRSLCLHMPEISYAKFDFDRILLELVLNIENSSLNLSK